MNLQANEATARRKNHPFTLSPYKSPRGRKSKLLKVEWIERLKEALISGHPIRTACVLAGISDKSYYRWLSEAGKAPEGHPLREFRDTVDRANAVAEYRCIVLIQQAALKDWRAAAWWLERVRREDWGRKKISLTAKNIPYRDAQTTGDLTNSA